MENDKPTKDFLKKARPTEVQFLYKYRTINSTGLDRIFTNNEIFLPDPTKFNDPFDCKPKITTHKRQVNNNQFFKSLIKEKFPHLTKKETQHLLATNIWIKRLKTQEGLEDFFKIFIKGFGIYSLSETPDDILMWSHYSDSHNGICLQFKASIESTIFWEAYKVTYQTNYPIINIMNLGNIYQFYELFCTKSDHWFYEKERRVIKTPDEGGSRPYSFEPELLTGVIVGAKMTKKDEKKICALASAHLPEVKVFKAELDKKAYSISIKGINC